MKGLFASLSCTKREILFYDVVQNKQVGRIKTDSSQVMIIDFCFDYLGKNFVILTSNPFELLCYSLLNLFTSNSKPSLIHKTKISFTASVVIPLFLNNCFSCYLLSGIASGGRKQLSVYSGDLNLLNSQKLPPSSSSIPFRPHYIIPQNSILLSNTGQTSFPTYELELTKHSSITFHHCQNTHIDYLKTQSVQKILELPLHSNKFNTFEILNLTILTKDNVKRVRFTSQRNPKVQQYFADDLYPTNTIPSNTPMFPSLDTYLTNYTKSSPLFLTLPLLNKDNKALYSSYVSKRDKQRMDGVLSNRTATVLRQKAEENKVREKQEAVMRRLTRMAIEQHTDYQQEQNNFLDLSGSDSDWSDT